jgi:molybdate transport system substrate-binding protein
MPSFKAVIKKSLIFLVMTLNSLTLTHAADFSSASNNNNKPLRVAVAANFANTLQSLLPKFTQATGIKVQIITGSTGTLFQQIVHGAPFDIYLAADSIRPSQLVAQELAMKKSLRTYTIGELAFWSASWKQEQQLPSLTQVLQTIIKQPQRIAMANPQLAPYGKAAKQALIYNKAWQSVKDKLITGINIGQTFQQVRSQAVNIGIVAHSQLVQHNYRGIVIPQHHYQTIKQQLVIIKASKNMNKAQQLSDYLLSETVQNILTKQGYLAASTERSND